MSSTPDIRRWQHHALANGGKVNGGICVCCHKAHCTERLGLLIDSSETSSAMSDQKRPKCLQCTVKEVSQHGG